MLLCASLFTGCLDPATYGKAWWNMHQMNNDIRKKWASGDMKLYSPSDLSSQNQAVMKACMEGEECRKKVTESAGQPK